MKCFSLLVGARNTPSAGARFSSRDEALVREITARHFPDGFTILNADGAWYDAASRSFIEEESRQILVCARGSRALRQWLRELATALGQEELLVVGLGPATKIRFRARSQRRGSRVEGRVG